MSEEIDEPPFFITCALDFAQIDAILNNTRSDSNDKEQSDNRENENVKDE